MLSWVAYIIAPNITCLSRLAHSIRSACSRAVLSAGIGIAINNAMAPCAGILLDLCIGFCRKNYKTSKGEGEILLIALIIIQEEFEF